MGSCVLWHTCCSSWLYHYWLCSQATCACFLIRQRRNNSTTSRHHSEIAGPRHIKHVQSCLACCKHSVNVSCFYDYYSPLLFLSTALCLSSSFKTQLIPSLVESAHSCPMSWCSRST